MLIRHQAAPWEGIPLVSEPHVLQLEGRPGRGCGPLPLVLEANRYAVGVAVEPQDGPGEPPPPVTGGYRHRHDVRPVPREQRQGLGPGVGQACEQCGVGGGEAGADGRSGYGAGAMAGPFASDSGLSLLLLPLGPTSVHGDRTRGPGLDLGIGTGVRVTATGTVAVDTWRQVLKFWQQRVKSKPHQTERKTHGCPVHVHSSGDGYYAGY